MRSAGQEKAFYQLKRIEAASDRSFQIHSVFDPRSEGDSFFVNISIDCSLIKSTDGGLKFRRRERFVLNVPSQFPFDSPSVYVNHKRFDSFAHVQWVRHLCLYLSKETEWDISDGMYGYIQRLSKWLIKAARNEHERDGQPLHPPVAYPGSSELPIIIAKKDTPTLSGNNWIGFGFLKELNSKRADIIDWATQIDNRPDAVLAPAILLNNVFPFEYPRKAEDLFDQLSVQGVDIGLVHTLIWIAIYLNPQDSPAYLIVGTPMRGVKGHEALQHLSVWSISDQIKKSIQLEIKCSELSDGNVSEELRAQINNLHQDCKDHSIKTLKSSDLRWCSVKEDRPEIVQRRDISTPASWFEGKKISIWGCGALGSFIAEMLARAGAKKLILRDNKKVHPGILVRQNYVDQDIGEWKSDSLLGRLKLINPNIEIESHPSDFSNTITELKELDYSSNDAVDLIIDATAADLVRKRLEVAAKSLKQYPVFVSAVIGSSASSAILNIVSEHSSGCLADQLRKSKIIGVTNPDLSHYKDEFWPEDNSFLNFQPEPGCSDPTFIGSSMDMMILTGKIMNRLGAALLDNATDIQETYFIAKESIIAPDYQVVHDNDKRITLSDGYDIRFSAKALYQIQQVIDASEKCDDSVCETGGLLFGEIDTAMEIVWVSESCGPPSDSVSSPTKFICGTNGTQEINQKLIEGSQGSVRYIGMWHTHPTSKALPSETDMKGMASIMCQDGFASESQLLAIFGHTTSKTELGVYRYSTSDLEGTCDDERCIVLSNDGTIVPLEN